MTENTRIVVTFTYVEDGLKEKMSFPSHEAYLKWREENKDDVKDVRFYWDEKDAE